MICEIIGGYHPFYSSDVMTICENIVKLKINWPKNIDIVAKDLLSRIFVSDPNLRIKLKEIKRHKYFYGTQWDSIHSQ